MKPATFRYHDPREREELLALKSDLGDDALILAGGQSLVPMLNLRVVCASDLVDINHVHGLDGIEAHGGTVQVGALTRHQQAQASTLLAQRCPIIGQAIHYVGHPAIRTRGTLGGSLAHADPAAELPAVMMVLEAEILAQSRNGSRAIQAAEFFDGPLSTSLAGDEVLVGVRFDAPAPAMRCAVCEVARRFGDFALVGVACLAGLDDDGRFTDVRLAGFGVGPVPQRLSRAESVLENEMPTAKLLHDAGREAGAEIAGTDDGHASSGYRRHVVAVLVERTLRQALNGDAATESHTATP